MKIVYLHGFRSSPDSFKARLLGERLAARGLADAFAAPALDVAPARAIAQIEQLCAGIDPRSLSLIGSSLGGYYATWVAERLGCRAVLLNPGIFAARDLGLYVGTQTMFHDPSQQFEFKAEYIDQLQAIAVPAITQVQRYFLVAATGDELLDWREMVKKYTGARMKVIPGSDHGLSDFEQHIEEVLAFCTDPFPLEKTQ